MWNDTGNPPQGGTPGAVRTLAGTYGGGPGQVSPLVGMAAALSAHQASASSRFSLRERAFVDLVLVRGDAADAAFVQALESVTGCRPSLKPNSVTRGATYDALWLGPDEWLVRSHQPQRATLESALRAALAGQFAAVVDAGSGYTVLELSGSRVREVLARGCPLDLHPRVLAPGQCAQSHYFKASIVLVPMPGDCYELIVRRSFADYLCQMMLDASVPLLIG
ncbi:sarcosine oxidase subunit gamma [Paraburkholderia bonniea]|uniref:sarcosine oxidase subunit gamma n=1 Tax=Paraburkholderia bonniea TaxID=2152891 RepID=UPI0012916D64|nr:sarcosine oxidase subunit gamma [Paraburkholderia bonniea]WJF91544.1 sarcosine oxidase subunit gamma [Paraburkholderia bonniea]WJF94863.1 sarcosine oxidase subunit gamma [Paraburkholderia bonniea]